MADFTVVRTPKEIARRLTPLRAQAIVETLPGADRAYSELSGPVRGRLFRLGLIGWAGNHDEARFRLTPLGIAVRHALKTSPGDGGLS